MGVVFNTLILRLLTCRSRRCWVTFHQSLGVPVPWGGFGCSSWSMFTHACVTQWWWPPAAPPSTCLETLCHHQSIALPQGVLLYGGCNLGLLSITAPSISFAAWPLIRRKRLCWLFCDSENHVVIHYRLSSLCLSQKKTLCWFIFSIGYRAGWCQLISMGLGSVLVFG